MYGLVFYAFVVYVKAKHKGQHKHACSEPPFEVNCLTSQSDQPTQKQHNSIANEDTSDVKLRDYWPKLTQHMILVYAI